MPKTRAVDGRRDRRYTQTFVADPSCCPSRSSLMTGRYPHNNGVLRPAGRARSFDGAALDGLLPAHAGYATYVAGKFLTTWPRTPAPPCFDHSTVMWGGYNNVAVQVDGVARQATGYSTTYLGVRGREYITQALAGTAPFLLYETPQAPHWVNVTNPDGTTSSWPSPRRSTPPPPSAPAPACPSPTAATSPRTCAT